MPSGAHSRSAAATAGSPLKPNTATICTSQRGTAGRIDETPAHERPSVRSGMSAAEEADSRTKGARFIYELGRLIQACHDTRTSAVRMFHRFYMLRSFKDFDLYDIATASLLASSKFYERSTTIGLESMSAASERMRNILGLERRPEALTKEKLNVLENTLLQVTGFDLIQLSGPRSHLENLVESFRGDRQAKIRLFERAWLIIKNSLGKTIHLNYKPEVIAIASLHLSGYKKEPGIQVGSASNVAPGSMWWSRYEKTLTLDMVQDICRKIAGDSVEAGPPKADKESSPSSADKKLPVTSPLGSCLETPEPLLYRSSSSSMSEALQKRSQVETPSSQASASDRDSSLVSLLDGGNENLPVSTGVDPVRLGTGEIMVAEELATQSSFEPVTCKPLISAETASTPCYMSRATGPSPPEQQQCHYEPTLQKRENVSNAIPMLTADHPPCPGAIALCHGAYNFEVCHCQPATATNPSSGNENSAPYQMPSEPSEPVETDQTSPVPTPPSPPPLCMKYLSRTTLPDLLAENRWRLLTSPCSREVDAQLLPPLPPPPLPPMFFFKYSPPVHADQTRL